MNQVAPTEVLARFLYYRNHYRPSDHTVKYAAFMPPSNRRLSVFRIINLTEGETWKLGDEIRPEPVLGRADIKAQGVTEAVLTVEADDIPPRHANIIGWPVDSSEVKLKAIVLAEKAVLQLKR